MREDLLPFAAALLAGLGGAYQWVRQHNSVPEFWTGVYAVGFGAIAWALCVDWSQSHDVQKFILFAFLYIIGNTSAVLGGTFSASNLAKAGVAAIPLTNSK